MVNVIYIKYKVYAFIFLDNQIGSRKNNKIFMETVNVQIHDNVYFWAERRK